MEKIQNYKKNHNVIFQSVGGGQGHDSTPLGAIMDIPIDIPLLCGGVVHFLPVLGKK
jgi:hypothetical protein